MGLVCSVDEQSHSPVRKTKKVNLVREETMETSTDGSHSKRILQDFKNKINVPAQTLTHISDFQVISELGRGGQADIFQIKFNSENVSVQNNHISSQKTYALRRVYKSNMNNKKQSIELGKTIMMKKESAFIMNGLLFFEDQLFNYQIMEVAPGGDLSSFVDPQSFKQSYLKQMKQDGIRFLVAGIVLGLENLHKNKIIYSDLKLENVLINSDGYPILIDFDMAQKGRFVKSSDYKGTLAYTAPQLFIDKQVDHGMDLWALGVLIHALTYGDMPYSNEEIQSQNYSVQCIKNEGKYKVPSKKVSCELVSLINQLLKVNPRKRLGYCNFSQIKDHSFFKGFDWYKYQKKQLQSPFLNVLKIVEQNRKSEIQRLSQKKRYQKKRRQSLQTACDELEQMDNMII